MLTQELLGGVVDGKIKLSAASEPVIADALSILISKVPLWPSRLIVADERVSGHQAEDTSRHSCRRG